jgi:hypothetical protein
VGPDAPRSPRGAAAPTIGVAPTAARNGGGSGPPLGRDVRPVVLVDNTASAGTALGATAIARPREAAVARERAPVSSRRCTAPASRH